jgi:hypothetical protein
MNVRTKLLALALALVGCATSQAEPIRVCIHDQASISAPTRASLRAELVLLFPRLQIITKTNPCSTVEAGQVVIFIRGAAPAAATGALGRAPVVNGRILPALEVFVDPVARLTGANDFETLGRALGRVAGHELLHYLLQQVGHDEVGLLQQQLAPGPLLAENRSDLSSQIRRR